MRGTKIYAQGPDIEILLGKMSEIKDETQKSFSIKSVEEKVASVLSVGLSKAPGLIIMVENGRLNLSEEKKTGVGFQDIHARIDLLAEKINVDIQCKSSLWENISLGGIIEPKDLKSSGSI